MWMQISAGQGPVECCRFVFLFLKIVKKECEKKSISVKLLDYEEGESRDTLKSVFLKLTGDEIGEYSDSIEGTIQWICKSPYRKNHKRKNWFIEVEVFEEDESVDLNLKELKVETMRSSGNGGQNVNKLETAVKITHIPTGIVVKSSEERSQFQNKKLAMNRLNKKLEELNNDITMEGNKNRWLKHYSIKRGDAVRVYKGLELREVK